MRLCMLWDMEGTSGIFTRKHAWYWNPNVPPEAEAEGRALLVADANAAARAALDAGAVELIVCDTRHGGGNFIPDQMVSDPRVHYLWRCTGDGDGTFLYMPGLDESVDGFLLPGHHAMAGTPGAFLPHTCNLDWAEFRTSRQRVGEMGIEACFAGHWGIPVIYAQGDEAGCREAEGMFPGVVTACVKRALTSETAEGLGQDEAHALTAERITQAIEKLRAGHRQPFRPALPMAVELRFTTLERAERAAGRPGVTRVDSYTVQCRVERHADVEKWVDGTGLDMERA